MRNYSTVRLIIAVILAAAAGIITPCVAESTPPFHVVETGKIIIYTGESIIAVPVAGVIEASCAGDGMIYYVSFFDEKGEASRNLGCIDARNGTSRFVRRIMQDLDKYLVRRLMAAGGVVSLHAVQRETPSLPGIFLQIKTDGMDMSRREEIFDFWATEGETIFLEKKETGTRAAAGGISVPITVTGDLRIERFLDDRLLFVTNGRETEIIDIRAGKSLYQYSAAAGFLEPEGFTLVIQAMDETAAVDDTEMIFYKVFVNGAESGRTDTGPGSITKEFMVKLDSDREYIVKLERWRLHTVRGKYERINNIRQPAPVKVFIPGGRVIRLTARFNGKSYSFHTGPVYK